MKPASATPKGYRRLIPSVTALVEFEAVARLGSFTLAAHELGVTQAAVSRQIKFLEELLGTRLFHRLHRSIALTDEGEALYRVVAESMQKIAGVFDRLASGPVRQELVLAATSAFSHFRLLSRCATGMAAGLTVRRSICSTKKSFPSARRPALTAVWVATNTQDKHLVEITHAGTQDPAYSPSTFSPFTEAYVDQFSRWYAARLIADGI
ncbi:LysR family transcriptional regulator [Burkholderia lata]|nr:LysR family transcriptional regulator [Burkholderia lata]